MLNIKELRNEYKLKSLDISDLNFDPFLQFSLWFQEAQKVEVVEPNAMCLATATDQGRPSSRIVLLKNINESGFEFFTNYESRKGKELAANPFASATFYWRELERQVMIEGKIQKLTKEESKAYFLTRPRGSQLGAWASHQSQTVNSREELEEKYRYFEKLYEKRLIPMPEYWGGFRLLPERFEFWQGRRNRLHDRLLYQLIDDNWQMSRLAP